jgi:hypothetical protein
MEEHWYKLPKDMAKNPYKYAGQNVGKKVLVKKA